MSKRVRVFQHVPFEGIGSLETFFAEAGATVEFTHWYRGDSAPDPDGFDLLVIMGGPMGVCDEAKFPWLKEEKMALKTALDAGKSALGICLGAQLMAEALGASVTKNLVPEIGWLPVERLPEAESSWAAHCFPERFTPFHWHGDTFAIPRGATPLFRSEGCAAQGFAWGEKAVALQFHPEVTPVIIRDWIGKGISELSPGPYVQTPERIEAELALCVENNVWIGEICSRLLDLRPDE
jgi:GMP synthase (glutamine-hydrolysing)